MTIASTEKRNGFGSGVPWSWLSRVSRVKFGDDLRCMTEFSHKHPGSLFISAFITSPMDQVQEVTVSLASVYLGIKDFSYLVFDFALNFDWWRGRLDSVWYDIGSCRLEH